MAKLKLVIVLFLFSSSVIGQKMISPQEQLEDVNKLLEKLEQLHPNPYKYTSEVHYAKLVDSIRQELSSPLNSKEFFELIKPLVTEVKDLHTSIGLPKISKKDLKKRKSLPLSLRKFNESFFVSYNYSNDSTLNRPLEVLKINGVSPLTYYESFKGYIGPDNGNEVSERYYPEHYFSTYLNRKIGVRDSLEVVFKDSVKIFTVNLATLTKKEIAANQKARFKKYMKPNFAYSVEDSINKTALLKISSFTLKGKFLDFGQRKFKRKLKASFKQIAVDSVSNLILDFRGNGGGYIPNITRTLRYIAPSNGPLLDTLKYKKSAYFTVNKWYTIMPPLISRFWLKDLGNEYFYSIPKRKKRIKPSRKNEYTNNLFILMDGGSYSATAFTIAKVIDKTDITLIGERAGGANWGSFAGVWKKLVLPNSKVRVRIPLYQIYHNLPNKRNKNFFIEPTIEKHQNFHDFIDRKDSVLEFAKELAKGKSSNASK